MNRKNKKSSFVDQWNILISLNDERSRNNYVHSIEVGSPSLEEILEKDKIYDNPLQIDPAILEVYLRFLAFQLMKWIAGLLSLPISLLLKQNRIYCL